MFKLDGISYDVDVSIDELEEKFEKLSSSESGRTQDGKMFIDVIGTFYNYTLHIRRKNSCSLNTYDKLFMALSEPVDFNTIEVPHNQTVWSFQAYITSGSRKLIRQYRGENYWGDMTIEFIARSAQRRSG